MSARKTKRRISKLMSARLHRKPVLLSDELKLWNNIVPVGREFGSPDFERLLEEDIKRWASESPPTR